MQSTKHAVFMLGEEEFGLNIMDVNIIEKPMAIQSVANFPKNLKGTINLRGDIVPVYSLRRKFGLEDIQPDLDTRLIITASNGLLVAYEVDKVTEIAEFGEAQLNEIPSIIKTKNTIYAKAVTKHKDRLIAILDHDNILSEDELNMIKSVIKN